MMQEPTTSTQSPRVVFFKYQLKTPKGRLLETTGTSASAYIEGRGQVLPKLEETLTELEKGQTRRIEFTAAEAFGVYDEKLIYEVREESLTGKVEIDQIINYQKSTGETLQLRVVDFKDGIVILDANHPFAGMDVVFEVEFIDRRPALPQEISSGRVIQSVGAPRSERPLDA